MLRGKVLRVACLAFALSAIFAGPVAASSGPEETLRALVQANAERDLPSMSRHIATDADIVGYTIGGRKYIGWSAVTRDLEAEFHSLVHLEIPIRELKVWTRGDFAWFVMELDYIRYSKGGPEISRTILPLRETGVLEQRHGIWQVVSWHESLRAQDSPFPPSPIMPLPVATSGPTSQTLPDLSGEWEIQEEDRTYRATLDRNGNGPYTWQGGHITTTTFLDRTWQGTWQQSGNDREGAFEVLLSEDGKEAKGVWWYTRVGDRSNIPPRQWGGSYSWKRLTPIPSASSNR
jgi:SnoaL-like domain